MVGTDRYGRLLFCGATRPGSCAEATQARQPGLVDVLRRGPGAGILADAGYQGLGPHTNGQIIAPPHRKFRKNPPAWYEQHAHLKNWRVLARHHGRRELLEDTIRAVASLLSDHQRTR